MGINHVTIVTCDQCKSDLGATEENTASFIMVTSAIRKDANGQNVMAEPALEENLTFCDVACLAKYSTAKFSGNRAARRAK